MYAVENGHVECALFLLKNGARVGSKDYSSESALYKAARKGDLSCIELLLKYEADIQSCRRGFTRNEGGSNKRTGDSSTALHIASKYGCYDCISMLVKNGAKVDVPTVYAETPLHWACESRQASCVELLLQNGANVNATIEGRRCMQIEGTTGLHLSAEMGDVACIDILLSYGANSDTADEEDNTPLSLAVSSWSDNLCTIPTQAVRYSNFPEAVETLLEGSKNLCIPDNMLTKELKSSKIPLPFKAENIYETLDSDWCSLDVASIFLPFKTNSNRRLAFRWMRSMLKHFGYTHEGKEYINAAMFSMNEEKTARLVITSLCSKPPRIRMDMFYPKDFVNSIQSVLPEVHNAVMKALEMAGQTEVIAHVNPCVTTTQDTETDIECFIPCNKQTLPLGQIIVSCPEHQRVLPRTKIDPWFEKIQCVNGSIADSDLNKIGSGVGPNSLMDIARQYLDIPECDIETYEASYRGDITRLKFKILEHWRNKNPGPDARGKLFNLLEKARKEHGQIDRKCYMFLVQSSGMDIHFDHNPKLSIR